MKRTTTFIESTALPLVLAFGMGVLVSTHGARAKEDAAASAYRAIADQVEAISIACGLQPDPAAIAIAFYTTQQVKK